MADDIPYGLIDRLINAAYIAHNAGQEDLAHKLLGVVCHFFEQDEEEDNITAGAADD